MTSDHDLVVRAVPLSCFSAEKVLSPSGGGATAASGCDVATWIVLSQRHGPCGVSAPLSGCQPVPAWPLALPPPRQVDTQSRSLSLPVPDPQNPVKDLGHGVKDFSRGEHSKEGQRVKASLLSM